MLGVHHDTIREWAGVGNPTPESVTITGADGKQYPATKPKPAQNAVLQAKLFRLLQIPRPKPVFLLGQCSKKSR